MWKKATKICFLSTLLLFGCSEANHSNSTDDVNEAPRKKVVLQTRYGSIALELFNETPLHRDNFLKLVREKFYDSLLIHRVQPNFMIQAGDPNSRGQVEPSQLLGRESQKKIEAEILPKFIMRQGALVAFHEGRVGKGNQSDAFQFMIIHGQPLKKNQVIAHGKEHNISYSAEQLELYRLYGGSPVLDRRYTIFGQITSGTNVLNEIVHVRTYRDENPLLPDRPLEDIRMKIYEVVE